MERTKFLHGLVIFMFLLLGAGLFNVEVLQGQKYRERSDKNCIRLLPQAGSRGRILDRQGNVIVDSRLSYEVVILPQGAEETEQALAAVSGVLGENLKDLKGKMGRVYLNSSIPVTVAQNIDIKKAIALEELRPDIPNLLIQTRPVRHYPYGKLACHVIGYLGEIDRWRLTKLEDYGYKTKDIVGFGGAEERYDYYLRQEEGGSSVEVDHQGRFMRLLGFRPPRNGRDLQLTLDLRVQRIAEENLAGRTGCIIIMAPESGEIIAMASSPGFNPSVFRDKLNPFIFRLVNNPEAPLINRAVSSAYPAGSLFKVVVATAGLETKKINLSTAFNCQGSLRVGRKDFACWNTHGQQDLIAAIAHSCNVFFYKTGLLLGAQAIHDYALKFGLSRPASFELSYEASGFVPSPLWRKINKFPSSKGASLFKGKDWFDGDTANLSIGQGEVLVTPLQMSRMMAVFANRGYLVTPYIVKAVGGRDISVYQKKIAPFAVKESTVNSVREGLRKVVLDPAGTGNVLAGLPVSVAGKTGTAQVSGSQPHAWFAGFFPFKEPKFVICVFLERAGPGYLSCVLAKQIIEQMLQEGLVS